MHGLPQFILIITRKLIQEPKSNIHSSRELSDSVCEQQQHPTVMQVSRTLMTHCLSVGMMVPLPIRNLVQVT